jgi:TolA-binding protein
VDYDEYQEQEASAREQESLRARSEQAIGEIAQALIENPTLHNAISAAFGAREKAIEAQHAAMSALNLPSAGDVERLERRLRSFSERLEEVEEQLDDANRENSVLRRRLSTQATQLEELETKSDALRSKDARKPAKKPKAGAPKG